MVDVGREHGHRLAAGRVDGAVADRPRQHRVAARQTVASAAEQSPRPSSPAPLATPATSRAATATYGVKAIAAASGKPWSMPRPRARAQPSTGTTASQISQLRPAPHSAVRVRLDRDPVVGLPHAELVGGAGGQAELTRRLAGALDGQLEVGDRAVDGVVLGPGRVGVDPADEVLRGGRDAAADGDVLAGQEELAAGRAPPRSGPARIWPRPPSRCGSPSSISIPEGIQGLVRRAELDPRGAGVEVGAGRRPRSRSPPARPSARRARCPSCGRSSPASRSARSPRRRSPAGPRSGRRARGRRTWSAAAAPR